jgi:hypothetical protein
VLDEVLAPRVLTEDLGIGGESDQRARRRRAVLALLLLDQFALLEAGPNELPFAVGHHLEVRRECVHGLGADAVQPHRELEDVVVVLAAGVDLADAVHHLAQRDAAAVVADDHLGAVAGDLDLPALTHDELVHRVVDDLLEHHVDAVGWVGTIADAADVHACAEADVLQRIEGLDGFFVVRDLGFHEAPRVRRGMGLCSPSFER